MGVRPVVVGPVVYFAPLVGATVVAVAAVRAVEEDLEDRPVLGQQLAQLIAIVGEVFGPPIILVIAVPRREVHAEFDALPGAGRRDFLDDVAASCTPRTVLDRVLGIARRPETETVVVFAGEDQPFHPAVPRGSYDLVGIKIGGIEQRGRLVAVTPLAVGKRVEREMQEAVELELVPG